MADEDANISYKSKNIFFLPYVNSLSVVLTGDTGVGKTNILRQYSSSSIFKQCLDMCPKVFPRLLIQLSGSNSPLRLYNLTTI